MADTGDHPGSSVPNALGQDILRACFAQNFALTGITAARATDFADQYRAWIAQERHGEMDYLAEKIDERLDIQTFLPGARSVVMVADQYAPRERDLPIHSNPDEPLGRVAKYARGRDYHQTIKRRLKLIIARLQTAHPHARFRYFADSSPVLEREHALRAAMRSSLTGPPAFIGKHTLLIHPELGSYVLLGGFATTLELTQPPTTLASIPAIPNTDHCGSCTRCIDACPTHAITPYSVNAAACISYLTLEHSGPIEPALEEQMGDWLIGCDVCQDVCPFNQPGTQGGARGTSKSLLHKVHPSFLGEQRRAGTLPAREIAAWTSEDRTHVLAGAASKRSSLEMLKRNAAIVIRNAQK